MAAGSAAKTTISPNRWVADTLRKMGEDIAAQHKYGESESVGWAVCFGWGLDAPCYPKRYVRRQCVADGCTRLAWYRDPVAKGYTQRGYCRVHKAQALTWGQTAAYARWYTWVLKGLSR